MKQRFQAIQLGTLIFKKWGKVSLLEKKNSKTNHFRNKKIAPTLKISRIQYFFYKKFNSHKTLKNVKKNTVSLDHAVILNDLRNQKKIEKVSSNTILSADLVTDSIAFSSQDLLKPNERLRKCIESFLLDQRSDHTRKAYAKDLKRFIQFLHGRNYQYGTEPIHRSLMISYKDFLLSEKLEHTTIDRHLATLRSFFSWLVEDGFMIRNPAEGVRFLNPKKISKTIGFSDEQVQSVLKIPDLHQRTGSMHYAILMILFYCGLRRSELCALKFKNLSHERGQYVLRLQGKGNRERLIVLIPAVWNALNYYFYMNQKKIDQDSYIFSPLRNNRTKNYKKSLDPSMIFYIVKKYAKKAGIITHVSPHSCRATAISNARDRNVSDRAIQEFAGWSSPEMITRYDKRKTSLENAASKVISYGEPRILPDKLILAAEHLEKLVDTE